MDKIKWQNDKFCGNKLAQLAFVWKSFILRMLQNCSLSFLKIDFITILLCLKFSLYIFFFAFSSNLPPQNIVLLSSLRFTNFQHFLLLFDLPLCKLI